VSGQAIRRETRADDEARLRQLIADETSAVPAKVLAFERKKPVRTVKGWQRGEHLPHALDVLWLARRFPAIREWTFEYLAGALDVDPADTNRLLNEISRLLFAADRRRDRE
jgi:hypothetical protein